MKMGTRLFRKIVYVVTIVAISAFAAWTGSDLEPSSTKTIDGKKFYVISTPDELAWFAKEVNKGSSQINAILKNDIVFGKDTASVCSFSWTPIGKDSSAMFNGVFDGNGFTIYGLNVKALRHSGLFGVTNALSDIKSISIGSSSILKDSVYNIYAEYLGLLVGVNNGVVENVENFGSIQSYSSVGYTVVGSICGENNGIVKNVINKGSLRWYIDKDGSTLKMGGLVGTNNGDLLLASNYGDVYGRSSADAIVGGIYGENSGNVSNVINVADVQSIGLVKDYCGGIGGQNFGPLKNSFSIASSVKCQEKGGVEGVLGGIAGRLINGINVYFDVELLDVPVNGNGWDNTDVSGKTTSEMQKDQFAWILNTTNGTEENSCEWSRYDGYPVFANDTLRPIYKVVFNDGGNTTAYYTNYKGLVPEFPEIPRAPEGKAFAGWFNSDGKEINLTTIFLKDQTVTAKFLDWEDVVYSIRFLDEKGNVLDLQSVHSGEVPIYGASEPTKKASVAYTYSFTGWSPEIVAATWHTDYRVLFDSTLNQYKVTYLDYDGTELYSAMLDYGKKPSYSTIPKKANTVAYLYSFAGWSPAVENVIGEAVYKAAYDSVLQKYTIEFKANGESLLSTGFDYGSVPKYEGATPTKPATKEYSYSFAGWIPEISKVTEATSYVAKFDSSLNKYMVVFQNGAKVLQDSEIEYGRVPTYRGETPQKTSTAKYDYTFSSWSPALTKVTDEATYTALFDSTLRSYEVSFVSEGETLLAKEYEYGTLPKFEGNEPSKKESKGFTYSFKGWNPSVAMVKDKAVYTAVFDSVAKTFVVTFMNGKDTLQSTAVAYGKIPEYKGKTPAKSSSDKYEFKFSGWSPDLVAVTESAVYKAVFDSTKLTGIANVHLVDQKIKIMVISRDIQISAAPIGKTFALFDMQGRVLQKGYIEVASFNIVVPRSGSYFIRIGNQIKKVDVK